MDSMDAFKINLILLLCFSSFVFGQDKTIKYDDALNVDGEVTEKVIPIEEVSAPVEDKNAQDKKESTNKTVGEELEEAEEDKTIIATPIEEISLEVKEDEEPEARAPKKFYSFLFDNKKQAVFETENRYRFLTLSLGMTLYYPGRLQASASGDKFKGDYEPTFKLGFDFGHIGETLHKWSFRPFAFLSPPTKSDDGYLKQFRYGFGVIPYYRVSEYFRLGLGTSFLLTTLQGTGESKVDLGNNQGEFFITKSLRTSVLNTLDLSLEFLLNDNHQIETRVSAVSLFNSEKKNFNYGLFYQYSWDKRSDKKDVVVKGLEVIEESSEIVEEKPELVEEKSKIIKNNVEVLEEKSEIMEEGVNND